MTLHLSREEAQLFLSNYHFTQTDIMGVFERLSTVQYDPLNPVGRNPDLVFQARVPKYRVDDWQHVAYTERVLYDSWDKQACLVPTSDWSKRTLLRERYEPYHDREILKSHALEAAAILTALDERGPLSSLELEDRTGRRCLSSLDYDTPCSSNGSATSNGGAVHLECLWRRADT